MNKHVLAIDFDGPIAFTGGNELFFTFLESLGHQINWQAWHDTHSVSAVLADLTADEINALAQDFHHSPYGKQMQAVPYAQDVLKKFEDFFDYILVTARRDRAVKLAQELLEREYPDIRISGIYSGLADRKGEALIEHGAEIILEDNVGEALRIVEHVPESVTVVLFPTFVPHHSRFEHPQIYCTKAYKDGLRAQTDTDKIMALRSAWYEVDGFLAGWLATR